jgi:hypothetical protein
VTDASGGTVNPISQLMRFVVAHLRADVALPRPTWFAVLTGVTARERGHSRAPPTQRNGESGPRGRAAGATPSDPFSGDAVGYMPADPPEREKGAGDGRRPPGVRGDQRATGVEVPSRARLRSRVLVPQTESARDARLPQPGQAIA